MTPDDTRHGSKAGAVQHVLEGDAVLFEHLGDGAGEGELVGHVFKVAMSITNR